MVISLELDGRRQPFVNEQVGDLLELAGLGDLEDVVAAVVQVVTRAPDGAQRRVRGDDTRQGDRFLAPCGGGWFSTHRFDTTLNVPKKKIRPACENYSHGTRRGTGGYRLTTTLPRACSFSR